MNFSPSNVIKLIVPFIVFFFVLSCNKDIDLLDDSSVANAETQFAKDVLFDDYFTLLGNQPINLDVLSNDKFVNPKNVKIVEVSEPENGTVIINEDNTVTYIPDGNTPAEQIETMPSDTSSSPSSTEEAEIDTESADPETVSEEEATTDEEESGETSSSETTENSEQENTSQETDSSDTSSDDSSSPDNSNNKTSDSFTYTTESVNEDDTVSTQEGNVTVEASDASTTISLNTLKAFPSAQGHGADVTTGGKGGKIFYVTSLANNDSGSYDSATGTHSGTLRYALRHSDPGYVIFRVSGIIDVSSVNDNLFNGGNMGNKTILGGTAPYPGIIIYGHQFRLSFGKGNWIFRGVTFLGGKNLTTKEHDAFVFRDVNKLILSDNTFGFAADEAVSGDDSNNFIVQRNLNIEGDPDHNTGSIFASDTQVAGNRKFSIHNNGYIHISHRFPNIEALDTDKVDVINQFAYNFNNRISSNRFGLHMNVINNYYKRGSRSSSSPTFKWNATDYDSPVWTDNVKIHTSGNIISDYLTDPKENNEFLWVQHVSSNGYSKGKPLPSSFFRDTRHPLGLDIHLKSALDAYQYNIVGKNIGARFYSDSKGKRKKHIHPFVDDYFEDAIRGTDNAYRNNKSSFTKPSLSSSGSPYVDTDNDGMADAWEKIHGLNVGKDDKESVKKNWTIDGVNIVNNAGFTNMQMFDDYVHGGFLILRDQ